MWIKDPTQTFMPESAIEKADVWILFSPPEEIAQKLMQIAHVSEVKAA